jgi:alpha-tubulin suppressor-like RCC1 family protein
MCWGHVNRVGGSRVPVLDEPTAVQVNGAPLEADRLLAFGDSICAIDTAEALHCWGDRFAALPVRQPQQGVVDLAIGRRHSCIIDAQGLTCTGDNTNGQIGDEAHARGCGGSCIIREPRQVALANPTRVVVGERHTCALDRAGNVSCWGSNEVGQLGRDDVFLVGGIAPILTNIAELQSGYSHSCALGNDHSLWCWGSTTQRDPSEVSL